MNEIDKKFLAHIREVANKRILFLPHALQQMARLDRMILEEEVQEIIFAGEIIEDYPEDVRLAHRPVCLRHRQATSSYGEILFQCRQRAK